jgi:predicted solute-binding protein
VGKLRISIVEYLNTTPLVWGFTNGPLAGKYDLSFTVPSQCAEALRRGDADVAIIPAIEYQRIEAPGGLVIFPGMAVAAKREVRSILVLSKVRLEEARRIALDTSSRSSAALVRILCAKKWKTAPEFVDARPDATAMLAETDAALVIGDPALRISIQLAESAGKKTGEVRCTGRLSGFPAPGVSTLFVYDVAHEWREMTGLPCVLAVWAARREAARPEVVTDFRTSAEYGRTRILEIAEDASRKLKLRGAALESYLTENVDFSLDVQNLTGLELYYQYAAQLGLIPQAKPIQFADPVSPAHAQATTP